MGYTNYITAIELSSSKISGAVGIETYDGIKILAAASTPVKGFITKGVVRNVDETSNAINYIINTLENGLDNVEIKRAYISFAGLSVHSVKSTVTKVFEHYTKITPEIIDDMALENDKTFQVPDGYKRVQVVNQEYRLDGKTDNNPIGAPTLQIEGNYLNIVINEQYLKQLNDSFAQAKIDIADSFSAARMDADILLSKDARRNGCALVNIGADTTTVAIYNNDILRKLAVIPLGSRNITMDLCSKQISFDEAEEIKITCGYKQATYDRLPIDSDTINSIINARMCEILQNAAYQIEISGERVGHIIFTGGGSKLKNFNMLLEEYLPNFKTEIVSEPHFSLESNNGVNLHGIFSTALYGLLKQGKENCCEEIRPATYTQPVEQNIFSGDMFEQPDKNEDETPIEPQDTKIEKPAGTKKNDSSTNKKGGKNDDKPKGKGLFDNWFGKIRQGAETIVGEMTKEDKDDFDFNN